jgi:Holliday junction resolvasome RuvABC endonuclease subunit
MAKTKTKRRRSSSPGGRSYPGASSREGAHFKDNIAKCMKIKPQLLMGTFIAFDPSSGSEHSQPAMAVFRNANLVHVENIYIAPGKPLPYRLWRLLTCLLEIQKKWQPDVVAIEWIPQKINGSAIPALRSAIGVMSAVFGARAANFIEVPAMAWKSLAQRNAGEAYQKSDIADAVGIAMWVLEAADLKPDYPGVFSELQKRLEEAAPKLSMYQEQVTGGKIKQKRAIIAEIDFGEADASSSEDIVFLD